VPFAILKMISSPGTSSLMRRNGWVWVTRCPAKTALPSWPGTALPGQVGNFAVAGHRTTYQHPFKDIAKLRRGDYIVLETKDHWFTYRIEDIPGTNIPWKEIVAPTDVEAAVYPVPDQPDANKKPTLRLLTFSSCHPEYSASQRYVIHAILTESLKKQPGVYPSALTQKVSR